MLPNPDIRTGSVQVKYVDGTEHTLAVHSITQLELVRLAGEIGVKDLADLLGTEVTVVKMRFVIQAAAHALTFDKIGEIWTLERIEKSFADMEQINKVFLACLGLSSFPQPPKTGVQTRKQTPYH
jgi:hypothetical protein